MRFVWKIIPGGSGLPLDHEEMARQAVSESREAALDPKKNQENLKDFFKATESFSGTEKKSFFKKVEDWNGKGDKVSMRMAGVSEDENDPTKSPDGYLKRHARLSAAFVKWEKSGGKMEGTINFQDESGNLLDTADKKVGLGDFLPPTVIAVTVKKKSGSEVQCVRVRNPRTGRIGYYQADALEKGQYLYVAVRDGERFKVDRTGDPNDPRVKWAIMAEHFAVYKQGAMNTDDGEELYYDDRGQPLSGTPAASFSARRERVTGQYGGQRASLQRQFEGQRGGAVPSPGQAPRYAVESARTGGERVGRAFWLDYFGRSMEQVQSLVTREDPVFGGPLTFLKCRIPEGMNAFIIPYLKAVEEEIQAYMDSGKAEKYDVKSATATVWREVVAPGRPRVVGHAASPDRLSTHSFGVAVDLNPGDNGQGIHYENLNAEKRIPMWMVAIFKKYKFRWGGDFPIPDAMHVEFAADPTAAESLAMLKTEKSKKYMAAAERIAGPERLAKMKSMSARRQAVSGAGRTVPEFAPVTPGNPSHHLTRDLLTIAGDHRANAGSLEVEPAKKSLLDRFLRIFEQNRARYERVGRATDMPPELIAAIHNREGGMRFDTYLHNGQKLGRPTTFVPKNIFFREDQWEEAAIHALNMGKSVKERLGIHFSTRDMGTLLAFAESYNGLGYRKRENTPSPYIYAGTNMDTKRGRYVADGRFSTTSVDKGVGVAAMIKGVHQQRMPVS